MFPVRIYYESAAYGSAISHRRSSVRARAPGLARPPRPVAEPLPVRIGPHLICSPGPLPLQPGSRRNFVQLSPVRDTCGTCVRARLCARTAPGIRTHGGSVYDERPNRYAIKASGWTVIDIWPDIDHGPPGCFYGIPVRSFIINRAAVGSNPRCGSCAKTRTDTCATCVPDGR